MALRSSARCQNSRAIASLEGDHVLLGLMDEDAVPFLHDLVGAHGDGHFDLADVPFLPGAFVEPEPAFFQPGIACSFEAAEGFEDDIETNLMRAMRVGEVACGSRSAGV